ncbi:MAG: WecB/TagA/CpsF family glycosyltransferase [Pseudomonadota bacterium]
MNTFTLFDLPLVNAQRSTAIEALLAGPGQRVAHFVNAHCVNIAARHKSYARTLRAAEYLLPDGSGISLAARLSGGRLRENLNGTDLFLPLCRAAAAHGKSVYLLGAAPGVASIAARRAKQSVPGLSIAGTQHGYFKPAEADAVIEDINASGADILLVAMGVPLQELWIETHRDRLKPSLLMGVGAQFDFHSGRISRAPQPLRRLGCEWIWRLAIEPRRMARRYLVGNPLFIARALRHAARAGISQATRRGTVKRMVDIVSSGAALAVFLPVFLGIAAGIRATSDGPVLFRQTRVGQNGKTFGMLKFRSMYPDAEARRADLLAQSEREGVCFKAKADPRVTPIGRVLRRYSLDELPQLLNVFWGQMSLVGPRPALPEEVAAYPDEAYGRLAAKPGVTGLWQIAGRADIGFDRMIFMDLAYVRSQSFLLDLAILALTGRAVVSGRGAY